MNSYIFKCLFLFVVGFSLYYLGSIILFLDSYPFEIILNFPRFLAIFSATLNIKFFQLYFKWTSLTTLFHIVSTLPYALYFLFSFFLSTDRPNLEISHFPILSLPFCVIALIVYQLDEWLYNHFKPKKSLKNSSQNSDSENLVIEYHQKSICQNYLH